MLPAIDIQTYTLELPSTGKKVVFRPFLVKEHKILMTLDDLDVSEVTRVIRDLVNACTFNKLDIDKLPHFDVTYIFLQLRAKSISETVDVKLKCKKCEHQFPHTFSLDDLEVEKNPKHTCDIRLNNKLFLKMKHPIIDNAISVFENTDIESKLDVLIDSIEAIYSEKDYWDAKNETREDMVNFVNNNLTKKNLDDIEQFFITEPKIVQKIDAKCPECGNENHYRIEGLNIFFV